MLNRIELFTINFSNFFVGAIFKFFLWVYVCLLSPWVFVRQLFPRMFDHCSFCSPGLCSLSVHPLLLTRNLMLFRSNITCLFVHVSLLPKVHATRLMLLRTQTKRGWMGSLGWGEAGECGEKV